MAHLTNWPADLTAAELAKDLCERLAEYYECVGTPMQVRFVLPGIDSTSYGSPADGIALAYERGDAEFQLKLPRALVALAGYRDRLTSAAALQQVLLAIQKTEAIDAFPVAAKALAARDDLAHGERYRVYATALQVAQGFGLREEAWDAVNALLDADGNFPPKFIFDAFELCMVDTRSGHEWWRWFLRHWSTMAEMSEEPRRSAAETQLRRATRQLARLDAQSLKKGLYAIFSTDLKAQYRKSQRPATPECVLLHELAQRPDAQWQIDFVGGDFHLVRRSEHSRQPAPAPSHFTMLTDEAMEI